MKVIVEVISEHVEREVLNIKHKYVKMYVKYFKIQGSLGSCLKGYYNVQFSFGLHESPIKKYCFWNKSVFEDNSLFTLNFLSKTWHFILIHTIFVFWVLLFEVFFKGLEYMYWKVDFDIYHMMWYVLTIGLFLFQKVMLFFANCQVFYFSLYANFIMPLTYIFTDISSG